MVVVVVSGRVHALESENESANALLWSILPGEEGGNAIADVLTGAVSPSGRRPVSLPKHVGQIPLHHDTRNRGDRAEFYGSYVDRDVQALYWFGHGLTYASFEYGELEVESGSTTTPTTVAVEIKNQSAVEGDEIVQIYVTDDVASVARPIRELIGFAKVKIASNASRMVRFTVHPSRLAFHGPDMTHHTEPGTFTFRVGRSSFAPDIREAQATLAGATTAYDRHSIIATLAEISGPDEVARFR